LPELVHLERYDFTRRADVLRDDLVRQWWNFHGAVFGARPEPLGKPEQRTHDALGGFVERETLQPLLVIEAALDEHLQERDAEPGLPLDLLLDLSRCPRHEGDVIERERALGVLAGSQEGALAEEVVGGKNVDDRLGAVVEGDGDFYAALHHQVQPLGRLMFIENDLALAMVGDALAGQIHQSIFHLARRTELCAVRHVVTP